MKLFIANGAQRRAVELDKTTLLGKGGEKAVHRDPGEPRTRAIAVYHDPTAQRAAKIAAFLKLGVKWPDQILAPEQAALTEHDKIVGFGMRQLGRQYARWKDLFLPSFCENNGVTTKVVAQIGITVLKNLIAINKAKIVVGDLNDGGILFSPGSFDVAWVDVDSWGIPGYPCIVGTELYLVPNLYNIDLASGDYFQPWMDHYSYAVLLFRALLRKHPFKAGDHPVYGGVLQRAAAGMTCVDGGVDISGLKNFHPGIISDDLMAALLKHLKREEKGTFPLDIVERYCDELTECPGCHAWYPASRPHCPVCSEVTTVDLKTLLGVNVVDLIEAAGRILYVQLIGTTVYCVAEERGVLMLYRKDENQPVVKINVNIGYQRGMKFGVFQNTLIICADDPQNDELGDLYLLDISTNSADFVKQTTTDVMAGKTPVFATSGRFLYRLAGNMLIREARFGSTDLLPRPVTQVSRNQCWFTADPNPSAGRETILGLNRDVAAEHWFVSVSDPAGNQFSSHNVALAPLKRGESLRDLSVRFDGPKVLLMRQTMYRGQQRTRLDSINADNGVVENSDVLDAQTNTQWDSVHGKAFKNGRVMHATDRGIAVENLADHTTRILGGTAPITSIDDQLHPFGSGILAVRHNRVSLISPK